MELFFEKKKKWLFYNYWDVFQLTKLFKWTPENTEKLFRRNSRSLSNIWKKKKKNGMLQLRK